MGACENRQGATKAAQMTQKAQKGKKRVRESKPGGDQLRRLKNDVL